jgi:hypothetical protein
LKEEKNLRLDDFTVYEEQGKIISEQKVRIVLESKQDIEMILEEVRLNIKRLRSQKEITEKTLENLEKKEKALLSYLEKHR